MFHTLPLLPSAGGSQVIMVLAGYNNAGGPNIPKFRAYSFDNVSMSFLGNLPHTRTANQYASVSEFSNDGRTYAANGGPLNTDPLQLWTVSGGSFSTQSALPNPLYSARRFKFSPDDQYLAVAGTNGVSHLPSDLNHGMLRIYKYTLGSWVHLIDLVTADSRTITGLAWSADGTYLVGVDGLQVSPFTTRLISWKRTGDTFARLTDLTIGNNGEGRHLSGSDPYYACEFNQSPAFAWFKRTGDTFAQLTTPTLTAVPTGSESATLNWDATGDHLAFQNDSGGKLSILKRTGDTLAELTILADAVATGIYLFDNTYLVDGVGNTATVPVWSRSGDAYTYAPVTDPAHVTGDSMLTHAIWPRTSLGA